MDAMLQALRRKAMADNTSESWQQYARALERKDTAHNTDPNSDGPKYFLGLSEAQAQTIIKATNMYSRVLIGQFGIISEEFRLLPEEVESEYGPSDSWRAQELLNSVVKQCIFPSMPPNGSMGINSHLTPERAKRAFDIHQVLRHRLAWDNTRQRLEDGEKTTTGVWHYTPDARVNEPLPTLVASTPCACESIGCPHTDKKSRL